MISLLFLLLFFYLNTVQSLSQDEITRHLDQGTALLSQGKFNDALVHFQAAIDADKKNYLAYFKRATIYLALGRHKSALDDLNDVIYLKPDFVAARAQRGSLLFKLGRLEEAQADLHYVVKADPRNSEASALFNLIEPVSRNIETSKILYEENSWGDAIATLTQVMIDVPWNVQLREMRAECYENNGDLASAISDLLVTTKMKPDNTKGILKLSQLYYTLGEPEESLVSIRECLKLDQDHKGCFAHYKRVKKVAANVASMNEYAKESKWQDCIKSADSALKHENSVKNIVHLIKSKKCHCLTRTTDSANSVKICTQALELKPDDVNVLCDRADGYLNAEEYEEAIKDYQRAHQIDQHNTRAEEGIKKAKKLISQRGKRDYYKILGVPRTATKKEVTKAYRKLAQKWHPDNFMAESEKKAAEKKFMDIAAAKEVLSDDEKRQKFDNGEDPLDPESQQGQGFNPFNHGFHPFGGFHQQQGYTFKFHF